MKPKQLAEFIVKAAPPEQRGAIKGVTDSLCSVAAILTQIELGNNGKHETVVAESFGKWIATIIQMEEQYWDI